MSLEVAPPAEELGAPGSTWMVHRKSDGVKVVIVRLSGEDSVWQIVVYFRLLLQSLLFGVGAANGAGMVSHRCCRLGVGGGRHMPAHFRGGPPGRPRS